MSIDELSYLENEEQRPRHVSRYDSSNNRNETIYCVIKSETSKSISERVKADALYMSVPVRAKFASSVESA